MVEDDSVSVDKLMGLIKGPDFPTGGEIQGTAGIRLAYKTGKGIIQIRSRLDKESFGKDRERIVVKDIPLSGQ